MIKTPAIRFGAICALCLALLVAGCSDGQNNAETDTTPLDAAEQQIEPADRNLEQAQQNLANIESETGRQDDKAAASGAADVADRQAPASDSRKTASRPAPASTPSPSPEPARPAEPEPAVCDNCGTVSSITPVRQNVDSGSGIGAIAGGVAGGALGSQIGSGTGKTIAAIAGTLGGAYAGNYAEKKIRKTTVYQVNVAMDAGGSRQVTLDTANGLSSGTRVRVVGDSVALLQ